MFYFSIILILTLKYFTMKYNIRVSKLKNSKLDALYTLITYTSFGHYLFLVSNIINKYRLLNKNIRNIINITTYCILFSNTFGYWLVEYPKNRSKSIKTGFILDVIGHGPPLLIFLEITDFIITDFKDIIYPILLSIFWLSFVWYPWYKITGNTVYSSLSDDLSIQKKLVNILQIFIVNFIGFCLYKFY